MKKEYTSPRYNIYELGTQPILTSVSNEVDIPGGGSTNEFDAKEQAFDAGDDGSPWASGW